MNRIKEFFVTLFTHRTVISRLMTQLYDEQAKVVTQDAAISVLAHALVHVATPPPVEEPTGPLKPFRVQRLTYSEQARVFERANSARFREIDAAARRKAAGVSR
jgi:hypothetical protein